MSLDLLKEEIGQILGEKARLGSPEEIIEPPLLPKAIFPGLTTCPKCKSRLEIVAPEPGAIRTMAFTTLRCPVCGSALYTAPTGGWKVKIVEVGKLLELPPPEEKPPITRPPIVLPAAEKTITAICPKGHELEIIVRRERREIPAGLMLSPPSPYMYIKCPVCGEKVEIRHPGLGFRIVKITSVTPPEVPEVKPPVAPRVAVEIKPWWQKYLPWILGGGAAVTIITILARRKR